LINILLGNGDAHLKNWTMIYPDGRTPRLSPLYDVVFTIPYITDDKLALNMSGSKQWYEMTLQHFERWAKDAKLPWPAIKPHLLDTMKIARATWPEMLDSLPMFDEHKQALRTHWLKLQTDFTIKS